MARKKKTTEAAVDANAPLEVAERSAGPVKPEARSTTLIGCGLIRRSPANPRVIREDDPTIRELATSIYREGQQEPGLVRPIPGRPQLADGNGPLYELVFGERRWRACALAGVPYECFVRDDLDDAEAHELTVLENLQREDLSPLEEADGVRTLVETGKDIATIADDLGKPLSWVYRRARLTHLSAGWREEIAKPGSRFANWTATHLELIARFEEHIQDEIRLGFPEWRAPNMTVKGLHEEIDEWMLVLSSAPWKNDEVIEGEGVTHLTCRECDKRSSVQPHLFNDEETSGGKKDRCLDRECWQRKWIAAIQKRYAEAREEYGPGLLLFNRANYSNRMIPEDHPLIKNNTVFDTYNAEVCKQSDEHAVRAFMVDGAGAGKTVFIKGYYGGKPEPRNSNETAKYDDDGNKLPTPLAERRKQLEARREKAVIERIRNWLDADLIESAKVLTPHESAKSQYSIMALAMASMHASLEFMSVSDEAYWQLYDEYVAELENNCSAAISRIYRMAYKMHPMMRVSVQQQHTLDRVDGTFARRMAEFHGLDVEAFDAAVRKEIKEPKAWANLNEDGTPKKRGA